MPQALLADTAIAPLCCCARVSGMEVQGSRGSTQLWSCQQPGALLGKLPIPQPWATHFIDIIQDSLPFQHIHPRHWQHLLWARIPWPSDSHFSFLFTLICYILFITAAGCSGLRSSYACGLCVCEVSSPPGYRGVGRGKGGKRREVEYFNPLPLICRVSTSVLCAERLRCKGCTQLSWSQVTEPGQLHSSTSIWVTSASSLPQTPPPAHHLRAVSQLARNWGGERRPKNHRLCLLLSQQSRQAERYKHLPTHTLCCDAVQGLQDYDTHALRGTQWLHTLQASKPALGYWGQGKEYWTVCPETTWAVQNSNSSLVQLDRGKHHGSGICTHCSNRSQSHAGRTPRRCHPSDFCSLFCSRWILKWLQPTLARTAKHIVNPFSLWSFGIACVTALSIWDTCKINPEQAASRKASNTSMALANTSANHRLSSDVSARRWSARCFMGKQEEKKVKWKRFVTQER